MKKIFITLSFIVLASSCNGKVNDNKNEKNVNNKINIMKDSKNNVENIGLVNKSGMTIETRYNAPKGYKKVSVETGSFADFLRKQKLKPYGEKALYYNGSAKRSEGIYDSVVDVEIGDRDLHQCADAIMLLRAEYFYQKKEYDKIHFNFVSGFKAEYSKWIQGYRINPNGKGSYYKKSNPSNTYKDFRNYMNVVFGYASTLSLEKEMKSQKLDDMKIGDVFIKGGSPGHAIIVSDMAQNDKGEKVFMLMQSYMPAQQTQVLINPNNNVLGVWYSLTELKNSNVLITPEWKFTGDNLKKF